MVSGCINNQEYNKENNKVVLHYQNNVNVEKVLKMSENFKEFGYTQINSIKNPMILNSILSPVYKMGINQSNIDYVISFKDNKIYVIIYSVNKDIIFNMPKVDNYKGVDIYSNNGTYLTVYNGYLIISNNLEGIKKAIDSFNNTKLDSLRKKLLKYSDNWYQMFNGYVDERELNISNKTIKVLAFLNGVNISKNLYSKSIIIFNNKSIARYAYNYTLLKLKNSTVANYTKIELYNDTMVIITNIPISSKS